MPIPDFQTLMLPVLRSLDDGQIHRVRDLVEPLADEFELTTEERTSLLPSGRQATFRNRVAWAISHMTKADLLERVGHGQYQIATPGRNALNDGVRRIDLRFLSNFPEYREFRSPRSQEPDPRVAEGPTSAATPYELMDTSYNELRSQIAQELLDEIMSSPPEFFEQLVVDLLVAMGYGGSRADAGQAVGGSGDGGIDGIIKEDRLGLDAVYVQAKRWENVVGRPLVQGFAGSLEGQRARKGVMITTSTFSPSAHEYVGLIEKRIVLIDGQRLAQLMIDHGIGVSEVQTYKIYRVDSDYFSEE